MPNTYFFYLVHLIQYFYVYSDMYDYIETKTDTQVGLELASKAEKFECFWLEKFGQYFHALIYT